MSLPRYRSANDHPGLTRGEKVLLAGAVVRGVVSGVTRVVLGWLLDHLT
jgi:hypothetical protein